MTPSELTNAEIADRLSLFAALLELADTSPFAVRACLRAADLIRTMPGSAEELIRAGRIRELRGIGEGIASKLEELVVTGGIAELRALEAETAPELVGYGRLLGLTPKRMREVSRALDVKTPTEFRTAVASGRLRDVHGVGQATETKIRAALERKQPK